jgi:ribosome-associated protein
MIDEKDGDFDLDSPPSKSRQKRERLAHRDRARELVALPEKSLERVPLSAAFRERLMRARILKRGALERELKYLAALLSEEEDYAASATLDAIDEEHRNAVTSFHQLERWRDRLIAGDGAVLEEVAARAEDLDRQKLMQLARNARHEQSNGQPPRSARALHRYLAAVVGT